MSSAARARNYSDVELDAYLEEIEPVAVVDGSATASNDEKHSVAGDESIDPKEICAVAVQAGTGLAIKKWPVLDEVLDDIFKDKFVKKSAPVLLKRFPDLAAACPEDLKKIWAEIGGEIMLGVFLGSTLIACIRVVREENQRQAIEQKKEGSDSGA